eukprot:g3957.t1
MNKELAYRTHRAVGTPSTGSKAESNLETEQKEKKEESKSMGWGMFFAYFACGAGTVSFLYYFYKAKYSFHQTEILIVDAFRRLPLYWPPTPRDGEMNSRTDAKGLPEDIKLAFCEWFVVTDLEEPKGVSRDDVLELISELGYSEKAQPAKDGQTNHRGDAREESLTLLCALRADAETKLAKPQEPKEGEDPMPQPKSDAEALEILKRKFRRAASVLNSAEQLRAWQATAGRRVGGAEGGNGLPAEGRKELMPHVKEWLLEAGLQIDLDGLGAKVIGRSPFLVVSAERSALELEAERLGYIKPHRALRPHVKDQDYGKIEFEGQPDEWVKGYIGYEEHDFWLPCERVQLLRHRIEEVPAPKEQMKQLKVRHSTALAVSDRLLPALKIAGLVDPGDALGKKGDQQQIGLVLRPEDFRW